MAFVKFPVELFNLKDVEKMGIMLRIIMRMDAEGNGVCFETRTSMCENLDMNRKAWSRKIRELEKSGLIKVERRPKVPNHITLTETMKILLRGQNDPLTRFNLNIDWGSKRPQRKDHMEGEAKPKKKKRAVRKRPANQISDPPLSELDAIHRKFVRKIEKAKKSEE
jgi:hypothetical protein